MKNLMIFTLVLLTSYYAESRHFSQTKVKMIASFVDANNISSPRQAVLEKNFVLQTSDDLEYCRIVSATGHEYACQTDFPEYGKNIRMVILSPTVVRNIIANEATACSLTTRVCQSINVKRKLMFLSERLVSIELSYGGPYGIEFSNVELKDSRSEYLEVALVRGEK